MPHTKQIHFRLPLALYEEFFRLFPGQGERSAFLRRAIERAIECKELKEEFERKVFNGEEEEGE